MNDRKRAHLLSWFAKAAAEFIARTIAIKEGVITVTRVDIHPSLERATVYVSVWPESKESEAMKSLKSVRRDFYEYAERKFTMRQRTAVEFKIDPGEKARRRFEEILRRDKK